MTSKTSPILLALVGAFLLALALPELPWGDLLESAGVPTRSARAAEVFVPPGLATAGLALLVGGLAWAAFGGRRRDRHGPWQDALLPIAMEHGHGVASDRAGLVFGAQREGRHAEVRVRPDAGIITIRIAARARQSVAFVPPLATGEGAAWERWKSVASGAGWQLRAELADLGRPLVSDARLVAELDNLFRSAPQSVLVHRSPEGLALDVPLPPLDRAERAIRSALEAAFRLLSLNA